MRSSWMASFVAVAVLGMVAGVSRADTVFDASGTFADGATLSGTVTIDTTAGSVSAVDLTVGAPVSAILTDITFQSANAPSAGIYDVQANSLGGTFPAFVMGIDATTLVGYTGGSLLSTSQPVAGYNSAIYSSQTSVLTSLQVGSLTAAAPLPSSAWGGLALLGGLGLMTALRHRLSAAA